MATNIFNDMAWYLYTYTGTRSYDAWLRTLQRTFAELKKEKGGDRAASELLVSMVAYYCLDVGSSYKGEVAGAKFKRCWKWPDFIEAWQDPDNALVQRWRDMRDKDKAVAAKRKELSSFGIHPTQLVHEPRSREALRILMAEITRRHGDVAAAAAEKWVRELVAIYGPYPIIALGKRIQVDEKFWMPSQLMNRELIPNMLTSYHIERAIVDMYGDNLLHMKREALGVPA